MQLQRLLAINFPAVCISSTLLSDLLAQVIHANTVNKLPALLYPNTPAPWLHLWLHIIVSISIASWPNENLARLKLSRQLIKAPLATDKSFCKQSLLVSLSLSHLFPSLFLMHVYGQDN